MKILLLMAMEDETASPTDSDLLVTSVHQPLVSSMSLHYEEWNDDVLCKVYSVVDWHKLGLDDLASNSFDTSYGN